MTSLRIFFLGRQLREKMLLLLLVAIGVGIWTSSLLGRGRLRAQELNQTKTELSVQQQWLARQTQIEAAGKAAIENLDPSHTFNAVRLNAEIDAISSTVGIAKNLRTAPGRSEQSGELATHSVQVNINRVEFDALRRFYAEMVKRAPYIGMEKFTIDADRASGNRLLNAAITVTAVEVVR